MKLEKIKGNTYYINAPTNIGVYVFKNKNCLLIDTGMHNSDARKIDEVLIENGLHPKYIINTHHHMDHCGGNLYFQNTYPGCLAYTSEKEKVSMENVHLYPTGLFGASAIKELHKSNKAFFVDYIMDKGENKIGDEKFEVVKLPGHTIDLIGIITREKVCFLGDSVFSSETLKKYSLPYLYDVEKEEETLKGLKEIDADYFVISHSDKFFDKEELIEIVDDNLNNIESYKNQIMELLDQPLTREDILENLAILNDLSMDFNQYHINFSAVSAFVAYLYNKNLLQYSVEDGKLYYFKKPQ
ncbi:MBL fold metallo-hydrolase [Clostridium felsineum]|uniref:Hydroxyacylglutathione hydrolase n=1 Tax=Clostridium felsineum TaxID=36839 RepID=A0A1S8L798_9CLOT|nr:MBL fold metallo-hydrolase [Clostridium felsineum]URZ07123.1 Hydroxyacylglutathione hydrolase [Clostridium felsineum]URZ12153.1 Hydroxyacylglutathione hydrolase [Clostridium felsineum]